jgi:hypothetical protein
LDVEKKAHAEERTMTNVSVADEQRDVEKKAHAEDDGNELHKIQLKGLEIEVTEEELTSTPDAELQISILEGAYWLTNMCDMDDDIDTDKIRPLWFAGDSFNTNLYRLTPEMTRLGEIATLCECAWEQVLNIRHKINEKVAAGNDIDDKGTGIVVQIVDDLLADVDQIARQKRDDVRAAIDALSDPTTTHRKPRTLEEVWKISQ